MANEEIDLLRERAKELEALLEVSAGIINGPGVIIKSTGAKAAINYLKKLQEYGIGNTSQKPTWKSSNV